MLRFFLYASLVTAALSLQLSPNRHAGCVKDSDVCIYPLNTAELQCETTFDFQVEYHVEMGSPASANDIEIEFMVTESGATYRPEELFGSDVEVVDRKWVIEVLEDFVDEEPDVYDVYARKFVNVMMPAEAGKGEMKVTVKTPTSESSITWMIHEPTKRKAKNVIVLIGDGMTTQMVSAARLISRGMHDGKFGPKMYMQTLENFGMMNPAGVDSIITDSANSASAYNTGFKSSVNALGVFVDSNPDGSEEGNLAHPKVELLAEHIKEHMGMSVGVVTTAEIQDATSAAVWSHTRRRSDKAEITRQAIFGCPTCRAAVKPEVMIGGGGKYFLPEDSFDESNVYDLFEQEGYTVTYTKDEMMAAADDEDTTHLLNISHLGNMDVWLDRNVYTDDLSNEAGQADSPNPDKVPDVSGQPNLVDMVEAAVKVLSKNENGFFLWIEAASIDKAAHPLDTHRLLADTIELDNATGWLKDWIMKNDNETLLVVTADHGHGFDVFGTVDTKIWKEAAAGCAPNEELANYCGDVTCEATTYKSYVASDVPSTVRELSVNMRKAVGTYNSAGYPDYVDADGDHFPDEWDVRTVLAAGMNNFPDHTENYRVSETIKSPASFSEEAGAYVDNPEDDPDGVFIGGNIGPSGSTGVHTMGDIGLYASGPGSSEVKTVQDNTALFHIMANALGVGSGGQMEDTRSAEVPTDIVVCENDGEMCHCADAEFAGCLIPSDVEGMCTVKDGVCTGYACVCAMGENVMSWVKSDTSMCWKEKMEYLAPTGPEEDGIIPCAKVAGTKLIKKE